MKGYYCKVSSGKYAPGRYAPSSPEGTSPVLTSIGGHRSGRYAPYWKACLLPPANEVCEGYVFTRVCHSVHRRRSTWAGTPPGTRYTPRTRYTHTHTPTPRDQVHPYPRYTPLGPGTHPDQVHPHSGPGTPPEQCIREIRATSGRYASYWNAFLLLI